MRVVVTGATGNVGTSLLGALERDPAVESVVGVSRRDPAIQLAKVTWAQADVATSDLEPIFRGADAVVHLAWLIQPSHDEDAMAEVNVRGSERVFRAVADAGVKSLVYASSVGAYSPGPKGRMVDESWPTEGIASSFYSRHKVAVERVLDSFEAERPEIRVVRLRKALVFKREAASGVRRLFLGPLIPTSALKPSRIPVVPDLPNLRLQAVHSLDVGEAYRLALTSELRGPFNIAADPVLDPSELARALGARRVRVPAAAVRAGALLSWRLHLQPSPPGWLDLALQVPLLDSTRAREEMGWMPRYTSTEALVELLEGIHDGAGIETPPLESGGAGPLRIRELLTGIGRRSR